MGNECPRLLEHAELILDEFGRQSLTCGDARKVLAMVAERLIEIEAGARLAARPFPGARPE